MSSGSSNEATLRIGEFTLDLQRRGLYRGVDRVHLTAKPFGVLVHLVLNRGRIVSKEELLDAIWGGRRDENAIEQAIRQARRALEDQRGHPKFIQTISGQGYSFIARAEPLSEVEYEPSKLSEGTAPPESVEWSVAPSRRRYIVPAILVFCLASIAIPFRPGLPDLKLSNAIRITQASTRILSPLLTDGARLYFQRFENGQYRVAQVATSGGETVDVLVGLSNPELCDIAPNGGALLVRQIVHSRDDNESVYIRPLVGGTIRRLGTISAFDAAWYPDGQHVMYTKDGAFYKTDSDGSSQQELFTLSGKAYWIRWSPDGKRFRFTLIDQKTEVTSIWEASPEGGTPQRLFPAWSGTAQQCCGSWTPDGRFFVFQVRTENSFQVWIRRERTNPLYRTNDEPVPLTTAPANYRGPLPGRDGTKLFVRTEVPKAEIMRYDRESNTFIALLPGISARTAAFSGNGESIAYGSLIDNNLWRCHADGTRCLQLTVGLQQAMMPHWSPDGRTIAFMGKRFAKKWGIFVVPADGGNLQLLSSGDSNEGDPNWSPDGKQIAFGNVMEPPASMAIHVLDLRDHHVSTLPGSGARLSPRWSPDGRFIVAMRADNQRLDIFDFASQQWRILTEIPAGYPNWSHDGKHVYFYTAANGQRSIYRVRLADRKVEEVASLASVEQGAFFMGSWIGLAPDDSPLVVRNLTTEDIYSWDFQAR